jgi:hypothetical protein
LQEQKIESIFQCSSTETYLLQKHPINIHKYTCENSEANIWYSVVFVVYTLYREGVYTLYFILYTERSQLKDNLKEFERPLDFEQAGKHHRLSDDSDYDFIIYIHKSTIMRL